MPSSSLMRLKSLGIDAHHEFVAYLHHDSHICRSEGFESQTRIRLTLGVKSIIATLNVVHSNLLGLEEIGLSTSAEKALSAQAGDRIEATQAPPLDSLSQLRSKIYGHALDQTALDAIIRDITGGHYSNVHVAAFLTAMASDRTTATETAGLTRSMVQAGDRLRWSAPVVADKHCVGGLPGNRTTPIVVAIAAAAGLIIPKTSSRAITSPAGTADVMDVMTNVTLNLPTMREVVEKEGACLAWGGALTLSPADDLLIRVARTLEIDSNVQLVASVLSKKIAAGATHVVIDMPVGPTAKVRTIEDADRLQSLMEHVAFENGLNLRILRSDGTQPVGYGIGPALEARDVLSVLRCEKNAPQDLRERALSLSALLLEFCGQRSNGQALAEATLILDSGRALKKFLAICETQGGFREPPTAPIRHIVKANQRGWIESIDNRRLARVAKLAGAPISKTAGVDIHVRVGNRVDPGMDLLTVHAEAPGELAYTLDYLTSHPVFLFTQKPPR